MAIPYPQTPVLQTIGLPKPSSARKIQPSPQRLLPVQHTQISPAKKRTMSQSELDTVQGSAKRVKPVVTIDPNEVRSQTMSVSQHVSFDWSPRRESDDSLRELSLDEMKQVVGLFPTTISSEVIGGFLRIVVRHLPPKPWPLTIATLPLYITNDDDDYPWNYGEDFGGAPAILQHLDFRRNATPEDYLMVADFLGQNGLVVTAVSWVTGTWELTVPRTVNKSAVPFMIGQTLCCYTHDPFDGAQEVARRVKDVSDSVQDNSIYTPALRPGVMIFSGDAPDRAAMLTTSGVKVTKDGKTFITVATQGFQPIQTETEVYHPEPTGGLVAKIKDRLADTDMAIAELAPGVTFTNELFENESSDASPRVSGILPVRDLEGSQYLYMDTPFTGAAWSIFVRTKVVKIPEDEDVQNHRWVWFIFNWFGQNVTKEVAGSCGAVVTTEDGKAVCFYRFVSPKGIAIGVAAEELSRFGYAIADTA